MLFDRNLSTMADLEAAPVPTTLPLYRSEQGGKRWEALPHPKLVKTIVERASAMKLHTIDERWSLMRGGLGLVGSLDFKTPKGLLFPKDQTLSLGVRHSNDGYYALTFAVGSRVKVCSNGMITGEFVLSRKHVEGLDLAPLIDVGLKHFLNEAKNVAAVTKQLTDLDASTSQGDHVIVEAACRGIILWSQIEKTVSLWHTPPHNEFKPRNGFSLYNAFTEAVKARAPLAQMETFDKVRTHVFETLAA